MAVDGAGAIGDGAAARPGRHGAGTRHLGGRRGRLAGAGLGQGRADPPADESAALLVTEDEVTVVARAPPVAAAVAALRAGLLAACAGLDPQAQGLVPGIALGDDRALPASLESDLRTVSLTHVTAVSGAARRDGAGPRPGGTGPTAEAVACGGRSRRAHRSGAARAPCGERAAIGGDGRRAADRVAARQTTGCAAGAVDQRHRAAGGRPLAGGSFGFVLSVAGDGGSAARVRSAGGPVRAGAPATDGPRPRRSRGCTGVSARARAAAARAPGARRARQRAGGACGATRDGPGPARDARAPAAPRSGRGARSVGRRRDGVAGLGGHVVRGPSAGGRALVGGAGRPRPGGRRPGRLAWSKGCAVGRGGRL